MQNKTYLKNIPKTNSQRSSERTQIEGKDWVEEGAAQNIFSKQKTAKTECETQHVWKTKNGMLTMADMADNPSLEDKNKSDKW